MGWDTWLTVYPLVSHAESVSIKKTVSENRGGKIMKQEWSTPAARLTETLRLTDDWDESELRGNYVGFASDFRPTRYVECPFKTEGDLAALEYLFPFGASRDEEEIKKDYDEKRALADEFGVPLLAQVDSGMDWLLWLFPAEEQIYRVNDEPSFIKKILEAINGAKFERLKYILKLGVDGVIRRGWYETADFWSPAILREFARPQLEREIKATHEAGSVFIYTIDTGVKPIADDLASLGIDCLNGVDPVRNKMPAREIKKAFPETTLWGGLSGPFHFGADNPRAAEDAVRDAFAAYGKRRLILGMACSYRHYYPFENFLAAEEAWKKLRQ